MASRSYEGSFHLSLIKTDFPIMAIRLFHKILFNVLKCAELWRCNRRLTDLTARFLDCNQWLCYYNPQKYRFYCTENYSLNRIGKNVQNARNKSSIHYNYR